MTIRTEKQIACLAVFCAATSSLTAAPDFAVSIHGNASAGITDGSHDRTAIHAHDPNKDYNLQGIDVGLSMRANDYLEGFINFNTFLDGEDELDSEWEEGFLKLKSVPLPFSGNAGTLEFRGGRYLNRIGTENNVHLHGWDYVNANLSTGMFLGEEGLRTEGGEVSWMKPTTTGLFSFSASYGKAVSHDHEEEHGEEEHEEEHEDEDHEEKEHEEHGHNESMELAYFADKFLSLRGQLQHNTTDFFQHRAGVSFAQGENGYGRDTMLAGADYTFTWRENGLEKGGKEIATGIEYFHRNVEWQDEMDVSLAGDTGQQSLALKTSYAWNENWRAGARYEWIEGAEGEVFETDKYQRLSLALTHSHEINDDWATETRVQFNHDRISGDSSNNVYLQLGFSYGGNEVR